MQDLFNAMHANLATFLSASVPLRIMALLDNESGGPTNDDLQAAKVFSQELGAKGDILLFGGKKWESAALANKLAKMVAILAFAPGGVECFGQRFEAAKYPGFNKITP